MAADTSSVVASTPTRLPFSRPRSASKPSTHPNTSRCVSTSISRRVCEIVEWSGVCSVIPMRNYLVDILSGLANASVQRVAELTPAAWEAKRALV